MSGSFFFCSGAAKVIMSGSIRPVNVNNMPAGYKVLMLHKDNKTVNPLFRWVLYQNIIEEARKKVKMHYNITKFLQFRYKCDNFEKKHKNCFSIFKK